MRNKPFASVLATLLLWATLAAAQEPTQPAVPPQKPAAAKEAEPAKTQEPQANKTEKPDAPKAPKRFVPSQRTPADNSASFPVDI